MKQLAKALGVLSLVTASGSVFANSFIINVENAGAPHGTQGDFGTVSISDVNAGNNTICAASNFTDCVLFTVAFGVDLDATDEVSNFAFNQSTDVLTADTDFYSADGNLHGISYDQNADGFGAYDVVIDVQETINPFEFVVDHDDASTFYSKWTTTNSVGPCGKGPDYSCLFAANVAGTGNSWVGHQTVVPLPAAAWLFISALGGLLVVARRKKINA